MHITPPPALTRSVIVWLSSFGLMILQGPFARSDDLANVAAAGNKSSVEMIRSYYADVELTRKIQGKEAKTSARYWRTSATLRAIEQTRPGVATDVVRKGGSQTVVSIINGTVASKDAKAFGAVISASNRRVIDTDPWEVGLFVLPLGLVTNPPKALYTLDEAVRNGTLRQSGWVQDGGRKLARIVLECDAGDRTYEVWVDPEINWMIRKCLQTMREDGAVTWKNEYRVDEFQELKPSVFVPVRCSATLEFRGEKVTEWATSMNNVRVNQPLPGEPPASIPAGGTRAYDETAGMTFIVGRDGVRIGSATPVNTNYTPPTAAATEDPLAPAQGRSWLGWAAMALAVVAATIGVAIRLRRVPRM